jgi:hypothetical protein
MTLTINGIAVNAPIQHVHHQEGHLIFFVEGGTVHVVDDQTVRINMSDGQHVAICSCSAFPEKGYCHHTNRAYQVQNALMYAKHTGTKMLTDSQKIEELEAKLKRFREQVESISLDYEIVRNAFSQVFSALSEHGVFRGFDQNASTYYRDVLWQIEKELAQEKWD